MQEEDTGKMERILQRTFRRKACKQKQNELERNEKKKN